MLVFDEELTPSQLNSISSLTGLKVIDRNQLILDIFAARAKTNEAKIQVELAQLRYILPRLAEKEAALSRLTGGIGGRGPGETKLEVNRRRTVDRATVAAMGSAFERVPRWRLRHPRKLPPAGRKAQPPAGARVDGRRPHAPWRRVRSTTRSPAPGAPPPEWPRKRRSGSASRRP